MRKIKFGSAFDTRICPQTIFHRLQALFLKQAMVNVDFPIRELQKEHRRSCQDDRKRNQSSQPRPPGLFPPEFPDRPINGENESVQKRNEERYQQQQPIEPQQAEPKQKADYI